MFMPFKETILDLTPTEFEKYSLDILSEQTKNLENVAIEHNKIIKADDGNYQIDGYIEFTVMGVKYKTLVECKMYKSAIEREKVEILYSRLKSTGAQKGILISTSSFQSGALQFAKKHGIALIQLTEEESYIHTRSIDLMTQIGNTFNQNNTYIGVMLTENEPNSISCSYLRESNLSLEEFMKE